MKGPDARSSRLPHTQDVSRPDFFRAFDGLRNTPGPDVKPARDTHVPGKHRIDRPLCVQIVAGSSLPFLPGTRSFRYF